MWLYSKNATINQPWVKGIKQRLQWVVPIKTLLERDSRMAKEEDRHFMSLFDDSNFCCWNLDTLVRKKEQPPNARRGVFLGTMDLGFGIVDSDDGSTSVLNNEFALVELKLNLKTYKNVSFKDICQKIAGTQQYLFEIEAFHSEYFMVCPAQLVSEFISEFARESEEYTQYDYHVNPIDIHELYKRFFNPLKTIHQESQDY